MIAPGTLVAGDIRSSAAERRRFLQVGAVVDLLGLGTYDITVQMRDHSGHVPAKMVENILAKNHVQAIAVDPATLDVSRAPAGLWHARMFCSPASSNIHRSRTRHIE